MYGYYESLYVGSVLPTYSTLVVCHMVAFVRLMYPYHEYCHLYFYFFYFFTFLKNALDFPPYFNFKK